MVTSASSVDSNRSRRSIVLIAGLTMAMLAGMLAFATAQAREAGAAPASPTAAPDTDFDGDGKADIFWYAPGAANDYVWSGLGDGQFTSRQTVVNGNYQPISGDFDGDGKSDIFWYAPGSAPDFLWTSQGDNFSARGYTVNGLYRPLAGDFNGDGKSDIFWYAPGSAPDFVWTSTGTDFVETARTVNGAYEPFAGDFNGDGRSDVFWYAPGTAPDFIWTSTGSDFASSAASVNGFYAPLAGDFNGDGRSDIFWYAPGAGGDFLWTNTGSSFATTAYALNLTYTPMVGDYNGDGRSDLFFYGPGSGSDYVWTSTGTGFTQRQTVVNGVYKPIGSVRAVSAPPAFGLNPVAPGARNDDVKALQKRLLALNYWVPSANGVYDSVTQQAVMAFQKYEGLGRDGVAGPATIARMKVAKPAVAREGGNHVEISIAKQTLTVVRNGRTLVMNTSTGAPGYDTPRGRFTMSRQINGMRNAPLGQLWRPKYFNSGIAMHGSPSIPGHPASHGCARLHNTVINHIWDANLVPIGTPVWVY